MKRKLINFLILVFVGVCVYFGYNKFFGKCEGSCESKDSTSVVATETVVVKDTTTATTNATAVDTTKK